MSTAHPVVPLPRGGGVALAPAARGGAANLVGSVVTGLAALALTVLVTRALPRDQVGIFFSTTSLFLLVTTLGQLGTATGVVYFIARARALGAPAGIPWIVHTARRPVVAVGVVATVATLVAAPWLAHVTLGAHAATATVYLRVLCLFIPVAGVEAVWLAATRGFGSMRVNARVELVGRPLVQLALVALVIPTGHPAWIALAWAAPYLGAAVLAHRAWQHRRAALPRAGSERPELPFWRFTGPRALTSVVQMLMQRFDIVLVGALAGATAAAVYAAATRFVVVGQSATTAFAQAIQPMLGEALVKEDHRTAAQLYQLSTAWLVVLTWPVYLVLLVFGSTLLGVFGHGYGAGTTVLVWLSLAMVLAVGCGLVDVVLSMAGHTAWNLANSLLALACNLGLDLWLIPGHGILGAAIGWSVAIGVRNVVALVQVAIALRLHPLAPSTALASVIAVGAFGLLPWCLRAWRGDGWGTVVVALLLGVALWCAAVWTARKPLRLEAFGLPIFRDSRARRAVQHGRAW